MNINDETLTSLAMALNYRNLRQEVISSNIANSETPGYKAKRLDFENALAQAIDLDGQHSMKSSSSRHFNVGAGGVDHLSPNIYKDPNGVVDEDGNTVQRDYEMAKMVENKVLYDATVQMLNKKLRQLREAIGDNR